MEGRTDAHRHGVSHTPKKGGPTQGAAKHRVRCPAQGGENTENGKNRTLRLWHVRRSRAVLGLSVAVSGWSTAQPGVRRSGERASE